MEMLFYILIAVVGIIALFFIIKKLAGCLLRAILVIVVLVIIAFLIYRLIGS
ncbi:hypothetical protein ACFLVN_05860 [Chloroflexota bacterium]